MAVRCTRRVHAAALAGGIAFAVSPSPASAQGTIEGSVYDSLVTSAPARGATVYLVGTTLTTTADARGRFTITSVAAGEYTITFSFPPLDSAGFQAPQLPVRVADRERVRIALVTPSGTTVVASNCRGPRSEATGLLLGTVRDADTGAPLPGASVVSRWFEMSFGTGGLRHDTLQAVAQSDAAGVYRLCGLPSDIPVFVRAIVAGQQSGRLEVAPNGADVRSQDFRVSTADTAARVVPDSVLDAFTDSIPSSATVARGSARLTGSVRDQDGRPVRDAIVQLLDRPGTVRTDSAGQFALSDLPAGSQILDVRAIGFAPSRHTIALRSGPANAAEIRLDRATQALAPVRVLGKAASARGARTGFDERRRTGAGWHISGDEIARTGAIYAGDLLRRAPGMAAQYNARGERTYVMRGGYGGRCVPTYYVDGMRWFALSQGAITEIDRFLTTQEVYGIEVYAGGASTPSAFDSGTGCGVVLIWTKR